MTTDRMLQFISTDKAMPKKREADARKEDFDEIYAAFSEEKPKNKPPVVRNVVCLSVRPIALCITTSLIG